MKNGNFYTTKYVLDKIGVSRPTLYKWFNEGKIQDVIRDRNNNRLFTKKDIDILVYKNSINKPVYNKNSYKNTKWMVSSAQ